MLGYDSNFVFFMNEIVKGLGDGEEDAPTSQRDEIMNEQGPSPGAKRARAVARQCERRGQQMQIDGQG